MLIDDIEQPAPSFDDIKTLERRVNELETNVARLEEIIEELGGDLDDDGLRIADIGDNNDSDNDNHRLEETPNKPIEVEATFYTARCDGCTGITYTGYDVRKTIFSDVGHRVIAVDPTVIPLYSIVRVKLADGEVFEAEALDIGGAIKGRRIDVLVDNKAEAYRKGRQSAEIEIIKRGGR